MRVKSFRSSSYSCYDFCPMQYYFAYELHWPNPAGIKAAKGNVVHKALELLAGRKLAEQEGRDEFENDDMERWFTRSEMTEEFSIRVAFDYYSQVREPEHDWSDADFLDCQDWLYNVLDHQGGIYHPLKRHVLAPERYFEFPVELPWAYYDYPNPDGTRDQGRLMLRGTIDLITDISPDTLEVCDWKTGKRLDWATGQEKTYEKLINDPQMLLYHYALCKLYPEYKYRLITIFFAQGIEPFTLPFGAEHVTIFEKMLEKRFNEVKNCQLPRRIFPNWRCERLCRFGKPDESGSTACDRMHKELLTLGMAKTTAKHINKAAAGTYQGGGRAAVSITQAT